MFCIKTNTKFFCELQTGVKYIPSMESSYLNSAQNSAPVLTQWFSYIYLFFERGVTDYRCFKWWKVNCMPVSVFVIKIESLWIKVM